LRAAWLLAKNQPYDFLVQSPTWKLGAVSLSTLRKQFDKTYVAAAFDNSGRRVTLNFILVNGPDGWVITDVESPHDSLRMFLAQYRH
jgi:ribulose bisphosphate carboxylase small subunit